MIVPGSCRNSCPETDKSVTHITFTQWKCADSTLYLNTTSVCAGIWTTDLFVCAWKLFLMAYIYLPITVSGITAEQNSLPLYHRVSPLAVTMANPFARLMSGRNTALMLAGVGAGALASGYMITDGSAVAHAEKRRLFPPRWIPVQTYRIKLMCCVIDVILDSVK